MRNIRPSLKNLDRQTLADLFLRVLSDLDEKQLKKEKDAIKKDAQNKASVWHATSELWDDGVIDPRQTREHLTIALATVYQYPIKGTDAFGVFRM